MRNILSFTILALVGSLFTSSTARAGDECSPCLYGCYQTKDGPFCSWPPSSPSTGPKLKVTTAKPKPWKVTIDPDCETWVEIYSADGSGIAACLDDGGRELTLALEDHEIPDPGISDLSWCISDNDSTTCYDPGTLGEAGSPVCREISKEEPCDGFCCMMEIISAGCGWCF